MLGPRRTLRRGRLLSAPGVVGLCLLLGGLAHREQTFRVEGAGAGLAALIVLASLTLVLPALTTSTPGGTYSRSQLVFVAASSAGLWAIFVFVQTMRHRDYFIPVSEFLRSGGRTPNRRRQGRRGRVSIAFAFARDRGGAGQVLSPTIERAVAAANAPRAVVGIVIAALVLLPETWAAVRAAGPNRLQRV